MLSGYMQEVNLKDFIIANLFYLRLFWTPSMDRKFQLQDLWSCALGW
jgi:hypothetical protein